MAANVDTKAYGWRTFAGVLIMLVGIFNFIDGIIAILNSRYLSSHLVFGDLYSWGWTIMLLGVIGFLVGVAILAGQVWAAYVGIFFAVLNGIGQLLFLPAYPVWSIIVIAIDVVVIYGLAVYCTTPEGA